MQTIQVNLLNHAIPQKCTIKINETHSNKERHTQKFVNGRKDSSYI